MKNNFVSLRYFINFVRLFHLNVGNNLTNNLVGFFLKYLFKSFIQHGYSNTVVLLIR